MTRAEQQRRWDKFKHLRRNCELLVNANVLRASMARSAVEFGIQYKQPILVNPDLWQKLDLSIKSVNRSNRLITGVENEKLGVRFTKDDIDILAPKTMSEGEIEEYKQLGWIIIVVGVVVLAAGIAYTWWVTDENEKLKTEYNNILVASDQKFCADPNSAICKAWIERKNKENFAQKKSTIEKLESGITDFVDTAKKGVGAGLAVAIALIAFSWFGKKRA